ncbi:MAG: extracellular solute-binding protein [Oscillospiraceae bacterium]|jgi:ABC-type glycerol-3-phosphate transport system substrate-binding protein|nr:extracellular solute-binding protein [Oscillospiraceae bacterium]
MKLIKTIAALLIAAVTLIQLASCSPVSENPSGATNTPSGNTPGTAVSADGYVYVPAFAELTGTSGNVSSPKLYNGKLYFFDIGREGNVPLKYCSVNLDGTGLTEIEGYTQIEVPEDAEIPEDSAGGGGSDSGTDSGTVTYVTGDDGATTFATTMVARRDTYRSVGSFTVNADGTAWVLETLSMGYYDEKTQTYYPDNRYAVKLIDIESGATVRELELPELDAESSIQYVSVDSDGNAVIVSYDQMSNSNIISVFSPEGAKLFEVPVEQGDGWINGLTKLADGRAAVLMMAPPEYTTLLKPVDVKARALGESIGTLPQNLNNIVGMTEDGAFLFSDQSSLKSFSFESGETEELVNWLDNDIDGNGIEVLDVAEELITLFSRNYSAETTTMDIVTLKKTPASEVKQKTVLTLACMNLDYRLREVILDFNRTDPEYRIKVLVYTDMIPDWAEALTKLNTEIIAGNIPDILVTDSYIPFDSYVRKGLFEDLTPYMDGVEFVPAALKAAGGADGKMYRIASTFQLITVTGNSDVVGTTPGWNMDEFTAVIAANPSIKSMPSYVTQREFLAYISAYSMGEYANFATGEVKFDSPEFIELLNWIKTLPGDDQAGQIVYRSSELDILEGSVIALPMGIGGFHDVMRYDALYGGKMTYMGFPSESRTGNSVMLTMSMAMSSKTAYKDGAWRFMSKILSEEYIDSQIGWMGGGFPTIKSIFDKQAQEAMTENYDPSNYSEETINIDGSGSYGTRSNGSGEEAQLSDEPQPKGKITIQGSGSDKVIEYYALTQEQLDKFMEMLDKVSGSYTNNDTLLEIITEETAPFFAGQKTAEEVAKIIQSRASIYVNEQR